MGTTLALNGAYNLAGALANHSDDYTAAFTEYEEKMRPLVNKAQKLVPGAPHILSPETWWGIYFFYIFAYLIVSSRIGDLVAKLKGSTGDAIEVDDYGFQQLPEWTEHGFGRRRQKA